MSDAKEAARKFLGCLELNHDAWHHRTDCIRAEDDHEEAEATRDRFEKEDARDAGKVAEFVDTAVQAETKKWRECFWKDVYGHWAVNMTNACLLLPPEHTPTKQEPVRALMNSQYEPPKGIDPESLRWAAAYAWAMAGEVDGRGGNGTELRAFTHSIRGHAQSRELRDAEHTPTKPTGETNASGDREYSIPEIAGTTKTPTPGDEPTCKHGRPVGTPCPTCCHYDAADPTPVPEKP